MASPASVATFCTRRYRLLGAAVLALAAFNLTFRLGHEIVNEWDESLYAISAWEMGTTGNVVATTFLGALDYYNTKPPLNVWLIALSFKAFGISLVSLRLVSAISAWLTVAVLLFWLRRAIGPAVALFAALVLATSFGFIYVHSGRSAETDAFFTLLVLLTVVTLWAEQRTAWHRVWLGPLAAAAFLLRGTAVLMPLAIILAVRAVLASRKSRSPIPWQVTAASVLLFAVPVGVWAVARWRIDHWRFFELMVSYDLIARSLTVIEEHPGTPVYYLNILQKHQYDWLLAGVAALSLSPLPWRALRERLDRFRHGEDGIGVPVASWAAVTLLVPTVMRTKLPWYLNPFYPVFALGIGWLLVTGLSIDWHGARRRRGIMLASVIVLAFAVAEGKLVYYSYAYRDIENTAQDMMLKERQRLKDRRLFFDEFERADIFVAGGVVGAAHPAAIPLAAFWEESRPGDCLVSAARLTDPALELVRTGRRRSLYCRRE
jgi:4-amino-4-deoxy-L-arabinose transferase-like glycosyltransferase